MTDAPDTAPNPLPAYLATVARAGLTTAGGYLVGKGVITAEQAPELVAAALIGLSVLWGFIQKYNAHKALKSAIAAPAGQA